MAFAFSWVTSWTQVCGLVEGTKTAGLILSECVSDSDWVGAGEVDVSSVLSSWSRRK